MAAFDRPRKQQLMLTTATYGAIVAIAVFFALLFMQASALNQASVTKTTFVSLGPLQLMRIDKTPLATGGNQATLQLLPGLITYLAVGVALSIVLGYFRARFAKLPD